MAAADLTEMLNRFRNDKNCRGFVIAMQPTHPYRRLSMEDILRAVQRNGGFDIFPFVLHPDYQGAQPFAHIQQQLAQLNIQPTQLDGQRFAFISASIINKQRISCRWQRQLTAKNNDAHLLNIMCNIFISELF